MDRRKLGLLATIALLLAAPARAQDDTDLFPVSAPPNVMVIIDNSGSMNSIVWHPQFDPAATPTCNYWDNNTDYFIDQANNDDPSGASDTSFGPGTYTRCNNTRTIFVDPSVQTTSGDNDTRWSGRYLNWYFSDAADAYANEITSATGTYSTCVQAEFGLTTFSRYRRARVTAAKDVLREVTCNVNQAGRVRFGLAQFRLSGSAGDPNGGYVVIPIQDFDVPAYSLDGSPARTHLQHFASAINALRSETWTPLAETLFQIYTYFMPRVPANLPVGVGGGQFPLYNYQTQRTGNLGIPATATNPAPPDPVLLSCQKNFVILITDGEPTKDDFVNYLGEGTAVGFNNFTSLIGDFNPDGENETNPPWQQSGWRSTQYLDDIAKFMHERDFRPDLDGLQTIDVYTVGFTTPPHADALLHKAADVGGGLFFSSSNPEQLSQALIETVSDILEKSQSFTAATVPATRTADGGNLYTSLFVPSPNAYWTGHLKLFQITSAGEILDRDDDCALLDPKPVGECKSGQISPSADPFWDAGEEIPDPDNRKLFTSYANAVTSPGPVLFKPAPDLPLDALGSPLTTADDLTLASLASYPNSGVTTVADLATVIIQSVRGCQWGTGTAANPCLRRGWMLGDIFHSNPLVVGRPRSFINELSYRKFAARFATRTNMVYAGSNDGFLHAFHAGDWDASATPPGYDRGTGEELWAFMPWPVRQIARNFPIDNGQRDYYGVDGSPAAADVWFYDTPTDTTKDDINGSDWRTILAGGLRQGGRAYYALDVTDPRTTVNPLSRYLWEFPAENDSAARREEIGETWGQPVITKVQVVIGGQPYERWVAIVSGGYDRRSDPNDALNYDPDATAGRGIYILDVKTGEVLGEKKFTPGATDGREDMRYAIPSTPSVFDIDLDGYADVIYAGDLGGNVWKWVIKYDLVTGNHLVDAANSTGNVSQPDTSFRLWFQAPVVTSGGVTYYKSIFYSPAGTWALNRFWLAFGTGERAALTRTHNPSVDDENNTFYSVKDEDPLDRRSTLIPTLGEADLADQSDDATCPNLASRSGFFIRVEDDEKFVTDTEIFSYWVITSTFRPAPAINPCSANGNANLFIFKVFCGQGWRYNSATYAEGSNSLPGAGPGGPGGKPDPSLPNYGDPASRRIELGAGMPTDPRVTVSPDGTRVVVTQQDGEIENEEGPAGAGAAPGQIYWREVAQ